MSHTFQFWSVSSRHLPSSRNTVKHSHQRNNGYRPFNNSHGGGAAAASDEEEDEPKNFPRKKSNQTAKHYSLTSICIISHFQFFSNFKECALALKRLVTLCNQLNHPSWGSSALHLPRRRIGPEMDAWNLLLQLQQQHSSSQNLTIPRGKKSSKSF